MRFKSVIRYQQAGVKASTAMPAAVAAADVRATARKYAFLREPDCPAELHALVGRRISMFHQYSSLYPQLRNCQSLDECADVAGRLLDAYLDNQQCWQELEYYDKHRRVLGRHPYLKEFRKLSDLRQLTTRQLMREQQRCRDNIWRARNEMRKGDRPHLDKQREARIRQYEVRLQQVSALLAE